MGRAARPEECVDDHLLLGEFGWGECVGDLDEVHVLNFEQTVAVGRAALGELRRADVEQIDLGMIALRMQQPGHCQPVTAVVARPGKDHDVFVGSPAGHNLIGDGLGGSFHQFKS